MVIILVTSSVAIVTIVVINNHYQYTNGNSMTTIITTEAFLPYWKLMRVLSLCLGNATQFDFLYIVSVLSTAERQAATIFPHVAGTV